MSESNQRHGTDTDVERLVKLGGPRRPVEERRAERVRDAAKAQWRERVRAHRRRRVTTWIAAGATAAVLVVAATLVLVGRNGATIAQVESVSGSVSASGSALTGGETIAEGAELATATDGRVAVRLASGHSMRLDRDTTVRLLADGDVALDRGAVYLDSGPHGTATTPIDLQSPLGRIEEIGTQYEARLADGWLRIRLREGAVRLHHDGKAHDVSAGAELAIDGDRTIVRATLDPHGPAWDWLADVTPGLDLDGRTAREFLDWAARERGLTLAFEEASLARDAETIVLNGTTLGLSPQQALDAVLPTCNMSHRIEGNVLLISALH